jgi:hypothetical protein
MNLRDSRSSTIAVSMLSTSQTKIGRGKVAVVGRQAHAARVNESAILPVEPDRPAAMTIDEAGDLLVQLPERHFDDRQRSLVGDAQAAMAPGLDAELACQLVDAPAAAVHDHRFHADQAKQRDVASEAGLERRIDHRIPAQADHQRLAVVGANVGQRLGENPGFGVGGHRVRAADARRRPWPG